MKTKRILILSSLLMFGWAVSAFADNQVMFNYQGRVKVQGQAFTGTGQFKFAIVSTSGSETLWSNDGTSAGGNEPTASLALLVSDGIFNVMIGDTSLGMEAINSAIFNFPTPLKLRTWFSDGVHGFQQLLPAKNLVNLSLQVLSTGDDDFTIYVNGATGNDNNNGLTTTTAKKTIQAAVDTLPDRLNCNVTIDIADGIYREEVKIYGIDIVPGKNLTIVGDEIWTPASPGNPAVRITGTDMDSPTPVRTRGYGFYASACSGIVFKGLLLDYTTAGGIRTGYGEYTIVNCKTEHCNHGVVGWHSEVTVSGSVSNHNDVHGFVLSKNCFGSFTDCTATYNGYAGVSLQASSMGYFWGTGNYSNNGVSGFHVIYASIVTFASPTGYTGQILNNGTYTAEISGNSIAFNMTGRNTTDKPIHTSYGGVNY